MLGLGSVEYGACSLARAGTNHSLTIRLDIDLVIEISVEVTAGADEPNDQAMVRLYNEIGKLLVFVIFRLMQVRECKA